MIESAQGNLLHAPVEALVNTVNTVGVMGKGIALQFKQAYPHMFRAYVRACNAGEVQLGKVFVFDLGGLDGGPRWILNLPTKKHWRDKSQKAAIALGLHDLVDTIHRLGIKSIAIPPLGCGNGGLDWSEVKPMIEDALGSVNGLNVRLYEPSDTPPAATMPNRTERPAMTTGRAAMLILMDRYLKGFLDPFISLLEIHKLMYFLQAAGQPLRLEYMAGDYGPYALNLRQVLIQMESHYTLGYGEGSDDPAKPIELIPGAYDEADRFVRDDTTLQERIQRVADLIDGYEDPVGMELLSSVHWVMQHSPEALESPDGALGALQQWNSRKKKLFKASQVTGAWHLLKRHGWCSH
jgi:O-acetyl-ADP-ribose deacetylase (regulator of RNase III)